MRNTIGSLLIKSSYSHKQHVAVHCVLYQASSCLLNAQLGSQWHFLNSCCTYHLLHEDRVKADRSSKPNRKELFSVMLENVFWKTLNAIDHPNVSRFSSRNELMNFEGEASVTVEHTFFFLVTISNAPPFSFLFVFIPVWHGHTQIKMPPATQQIMLVDSALNNTSLSVTGHMLSLDITVWNIFKCWWL